MAKNKVKLNDKSDNKNKKKNNKLKNEKYISDDAREMRRFVIILFSVIIVVLIVYGVSRVLIDEPEENSGNAVTPGVIDYDMVSVGTMLNRRYDEYYVAIYDEDDPRAIYYSTIITLYTDTDDAIKVYYCNLGNYLNQKYKVSDGGHTNPDAKSISELALGDLTLIKVENGEIAEYLEGLDAIRGEFGV